MEHNTTMQGKPRSLAATRPGCYAAPLRGARLKGSPRVARCLQVTKIDVTLRRSSNNGSSPDIN